MRLNGLRPCRAFASGLAAVLMLGGCEARSGNADNDPYRDTRSGDGVQGSVTDPRCKEQQLVVPCNQAALIAGRLSSPAHDHQVEQRRIDVGPDGSVRLRCHYLAKDEVPAGTVSHYVDVFNIAGSEVAARQTSERTVRLTGGGAYQGWLVNLTFEWPGRNVDPHQDVSVRCDGTWRGP